MNTAEIKAVMDKILPPEINGVQRPQEKLDISKDFFNEVSQLIWADRAKFDMLNFIFSVLLSNDTLLKNWVEEANQSISNQDFRVVSEKLKGVMTPEMLKKLNGIAVGAQVNQNAFAKVIIGENTFSAISVDDAITLQKGNNISFSIDKVTRAITISAKDTTYAVVSTTEPGLVPIRDGSSTKYLCADGTWKQVTQYIHPESGVTAGTYHSVTVNEQGHVTAGSNPTTLAGYGITDAAPLDHGIHVPSGGSDGTFLRGDLTWQAISGLGGIVAYSLNQNGYVKFGCGLILQWGINSAGNNGSEGESGWYAFPVNFNSACFALFCGLRNTDTNNPTKYDSEVQPRNWTTSKFNVYKQDYGGDPWFGSFIWFAIGR